MKCDTCGAGIGYVPGFRDTCRGCLGRKCDALLAEVKRLRAELDCAKNIQAAEKKILIAEIAAHASTKTKVAWLRMALEQISKGCAFPETDVQRAVRDVACAALERDND